MEVEYRYGIWSPPTDIWDLINGFLGFIKLHKETADKYYQVFKVLHRTNVSGKELHAIYSLLPLEYHVHHIKDYLIHVDMMQNGNFLPDISLNRYLDSIFDNQESLPSIVESS